MAVAVIADAHIGGPGGEAGPLAAQLKRLADGRCRHLVLLGDLFQVWVGHRRYETGAIREVVAALEELRRAGLRIDYVEGNRDFFLDNSPYAYLFDSISREMAVEAGGRRILLVHGDGLNERDWLYRFWRWLSKSRPVRFAMFHLPAPLARRLVVGAERGLARTNFKHKSRIPRGPIERYAAERFAEGHDLLLLGHFHQPERWQLAGGEVWLLDAWFNSRSIEWLGGAAPGAESAAGACNEPAGKRD